MAKFRQEAEKGQGRLRTALPEPSDMEPSSELQAAYWKYVAGTVEYGADNEGSLFDSDVKVSSTATHRFASGNALSGVCVCFRRSNFA